MGFISLVITLLVPSHFMDHSTNFKAMVHNFLGIYFKRFLDGIGEKCSVNLIWSHVNSVRIPLYSIVLIFKFLTNVLPPIRLIFLGWILPLSLNTYYLLPGTKNGFDKSRLLIWCQHNKDKLQISEQLKILNHLKWTVYLLRNWLSIFISPA